MLNAGKMRDQPAILRKNNIPCRFLSSPLLPGTVAPLLFLQRQWHTYCEPSSCWMTAGVYAQDSGTTFHIDVFFRIEKLPENAQKSGTADTFVV